VLDAYGRDLTMFDVESFSFYKGPHGSSLGVPHSMGVIEVVTRAPDKEARGEFSYRMGNYNSHQLKGHVSGPLSANLFLGLDGYFAKDEGWFEDRLTGDAYGKHKTASGRARLRWLPSDQLEFDLTVGVGSHDDDPAVYLSPGGNKDFYDTYTSPDAYADGGQSYQALKALWKGEGWQIKSITSHRNTEFDDSDPAFLQNIFYPGSLPRIRELDIEAWTQEIRVESTEADAAWRWRAGLFLSSRDSNLDHYMLGLGPWEGGNTMDYDLEDYAIYGEVTHAVGECLELSAGLRLQTLRDHTVSSFTPTNFAERIGGVAFNLDERDDFSAALPMVAAAWEWSDNQRSYLRLSTWMQPGGLALAAAGSIDYDSEYSTHYELGHDSVFRDGSLRLHVAAFYTDYEDYQSFQFNPAGQTIYNADEAHALGIEGEIRWMPCLGLEVYASAGYTKARFDDFQSPIGDFSGKRVNNIPVCTMNAGATYRTDWGGVARLDWRYVGDTWFDEGNSVKQEAYSTFVARIGYEKGDFGIYLYGSNLFDTEYYTQAYLFQGQPSASPGIPRIVGVEMRAGF
jgi:iron complex outermembrane receptor protein